jgi:hypothetical protein
MKTESIPRRKLALRVVVGEGFSVPASQVLTMFRFDANLPSKQEYEALREELRRNPETIPDCQPFKLLFPRAYSRGLTEGQGDKVTDDTIPFLKFEGGQWIEGHLNTGDVWGGHRDDPVTAEYHVVEFAL